MKKMSVTYKLIKEKDLTPKKVNDINSIQKECFSNVSNKEASEDFYDPKVCRVLAYKGEELVGCADIHLKKHKYKNKAFLLGGPAGFCVTEHMRGKGIGSKLCKLSMKYLKNNNCDVAFLSVDKDSIATSLYRKFGFVDFPSYYSWKKSNGKIGKDNDGMIAPVQNYELFKDIFDSNETFYVGEGYW